MGQSRYALNLSIAYACNTPLDFHVGLKLLSAKLIDVVQCSYSSLLFIEKVLHNIRYKFYINSMLYCKVHAVMSGKQIIKEILTS